MKAYLALAVLLLTAPTWAQEQPAAHFTVKMPDLSGQDGQPEADTSPMVCRKGLDQTDTRLAGPRVCKSQKQWDALHAQGLDIGPDGRSVIALEKYRAVHPAACGSTAGCGN